MIRSQSTVVSRRRSLAELLSLARKADASLGGQLLLAKILGRPRSWVLAHPEAELDFEQARDFERDFGRLLNGAALPHLLGWWEFYGRRFQVTPSVLIPRPETELMIEIALEEARDGLRALDLGTGSGCVAVTLGLELPESTVFATDVSVASLGVAQSNAKLYDVDDRVQFVAADLLSGLEANFDLICANLPYISSSELETLGVAGREPLIALDGGVDGLQLVRRALERLAAYLRPRGLALFEIDPRQADRVVSLAEAVLPSGTVEIASDLAGRSRAVAIYNG